MNKRDLITESESILGHLRETHVPRLRHAAEDGSAAGLEALLAAGGDVDAEDERGWTLLHCASRKGDVAAMARLVERGADVHKVTKEGQSALHLSAQQGKADAVKYLLDQDVAVDAPDKSLWRALHLAAHSRHLDVVALLVEHGADVDGIVKDDWAPVHFAAYQGNVRTMALLVEHGADVNKLTRDSSSALYLSAERGELAAAQYLLDKGASVDISTKDGWSPLHAAANRGHLLMMRLLVERGADVQQASNIGELPVHVAARKGMMEAAEYLLEHGAPVNATYDNGSSAILLAARSGDVRTMALLMKHGADVHATFMTGESTLHMSALGGKADAVRFLIEHGVALDVVDEAGWSALHFAAYSGDVETIKLLVGLGGDVHALTKLGQSAVFLAAWKGNADAVKYLLGYGVAQSSNSRGWTPLYAAADNGDVPTMEHLIAHGGDVNHTTKSGHSVLHQAVYRGRVSALKYLLDLNADVNAIAENDGNWETALILAVCHSDLQLSCDIAFILCTRGAEWNEEHRRQAIRVWKIRDEAKGVSPGEHETRQWREGLCVCVRYWSQKRLTTEVPIEVIARGAASVETYLTDIAESGAEGVTIRCKSCVVGPSMWGKTSLVRTLVAKELSLTQLKDRTVGIDLVTCVFKNDHSNQDTASAEQLEVTFWDFAGQTVYHVAHGPFFSRRTLYVVAVDVQTYSKKLRDAQAKSQREMETTMNRFISAHMWRWVRLITANQPDARFVFVGTKVDLVDDVSMIQAVQDDVQDRFRALERERVRDDGDSRAASSFKWISLDGRKPESITAARQFVQETISSLDIGFRMGKMYSSVLRNVKARREDARSACNDSDRIECSIVLVTRLCRELVRAIDGLKYEECEQILRTLNDLGDILWYEHTNAGVLTDFIILDPMLVIDVVREVVRHDFDAKTGIEWPRDGRVAHDLLATFALWKDMDRELLHAFKKLLHHFQLAYPADEDVMQPESDLIVPTYWKVSRFASSRALLTQGSACDVFAEHRWCWEYEVSNELAEIIFDQFAVQTHAAELNRVIRGACIEATCSEFATSVKLLQQSANSDVIRIEVSGTTMERSWHTMRYYLMNMEKVLDGYKDISVGRYILERASANTKVDSRHPVGPVAHAIKTAIARGISEQSVRARMPWTPPDLQWFVGELWKKDILQFQQLQMQSMVEAKLDVLRKLAIAGQAPRFPALWSLERRPDKNKAVVRVLSDLSGVCYHAPIEIDTGSPVLTQYGSFFKVGLSIVSTVLTEALSVPLVEKATSSIKTRLGNQVDHAHEVHNLIEHLDIGFSSTVASSGSTVTFESRTAKLPPGVAKTVLQALLKLHNDSSDELNVSELTNLECVVTKNGEYVWAHEHEIQTLGSMVTRCAAPPSVWNDLPEPAPAPGPSAPASPTNKASGSTNDTKFKLTLSVDSVIGLTDWDQYKTYCKWELFYGETSTAPIASGATTQHTDATVAPSWATTRTSIESVTSVEMLRECRLVVQLKRRSRIGWTKLIGEADVSLLEKVNLSPPQPWQSDVIQVPLGEKASPAKPCSVTIQLAREV